MKKEKIFEWQKFLPFMSESDLYSPGVVIGSGSGV